MRKILIVDDDVDITDLVVNRLKKNNYDVICSNDGDSGYKKALKEKPDLIILDVMMPKMQGGEVAKLLRSHETTKNTPILFLTALATNLQDSADPETINVNGQMYPAIPKPFDPNKLLSAIKSLVG